MRKRSLTALIGVIVGVLLMGGVAYAAGFIVPTVDPQPSDHYYACVRSSGVVRYGTIRLNAQPTTCPAATDTIRSWNAQGPKGDTGAQGPPAPTVVSYEWNITSDSDGFASPLQAAKYVSLPAGGLPFSGRVVGHVTVSAEGVLPQGFQCEMDVPGEQRFFVSDTTGHAEATANIDLHLELTASPSMNVYGECLSNGATVSISGVLDFYEDPGPKPVS